MADKILAPFQYSGTMNSSLFEQWFEGQLLPVLEKDTVIVMDNASFHSEKRLFCIAQKYDCRLIFLPPCCPYLNPIENFWSWLKRKLKEILSDYSSFDDALCAPSIPWIGKQETPPPHKRQS